MPARARGVKQDQFANIAHIQVTESAANTLTYKKLETGISLFEKVAWIIHRVAYYLDGGDFANFGGNGDYLEMGISTSDAPTAPSFDEASFVDIYRMIRNDFGTAGTGTLWPSPFIRDFTNLPGMGLIVPPNPIYLWVKGTAMSAECVVDARLFYTAKTLRAEEYWELVEARRIISST
jgi:hypothetical protein